MEIESLAVRNDAPLFFDASKLSPAPEYVCWIDVMGSESIMLRSLKTASNFVMKLHIAALTVCERINVDVFPVIDGMYVCSPSQKPILDFIDYVYSMLADTFINEPEQYKTFVIRGGLAYGPIVKGSQTLVCNEKLRNCPEYTKRVLIGGALTQAFRIEEKSSPFGLAIHESVRTFAPAGSNVLSMTFWKWWISNKVDGQMKAFQVYECLKKYFDWCSKHTVELSYSQEQIKKHQALANEYFSEFIT